MNNHNYLTKDENFIHNKFGYIYYTIPCNKYKDSWIYNLYVYPRFRRKGHATHLIECAIQEIRYNGYIGSIKIEAISKRKCININRLIHFYKTMGLEVMNIKK